MILSQSSEYALRAVVALALKHGEGPQRAKDLSDKISIPPHYLSKIMRKLVEADLLTASKGHNGGFVLAKPSNRIKIIDILEAVEVKVAKKHCIFGWRICSSQNPCVLHHRWNAVNEAFQKWARTTTVADIERDAKNSSNWLSPVSKMLKKPGCD